MSGRVGSAFDLAAVVALPLWTAAVIAAFFVVVCVLALVRGWPDGRGMTVARVAVVLIAALIGSVVIDHVVRRDLAGDRRALDTLTHELTARAITPGSALACLDAMAGDAVESSCEKALFATPEATAAAVSYVGAQLSLLAAGSAQAQRLDAEPGNHAGASAPRRRARPFRHRGARAGGARRLHARPMRRLCHAARSQPGAGEHGGTHLRVFGQPPRGGLGARRRSSGRRAFAARRYRTRRLPRRWPLPSRPAISSSRHRPRSRPSAS